jgi:hypothetical protein
MSLTASSVDLRSSHSADSCAYRSMSDGVPLQRREHATMIETRA